MFCYEAFVFANPVADVCSATVLDVCDDFCDVFWAHFGALASLWVHFGSPRPPFGSVLVPKVDLLDDLWASFGALGLFFWSHLGEKDEKKRLPRELESSILGSKMEPKWSPNGEHMKTKIIKKKHMFYSKS